MRCGRDRLDGDKAVLRDWAVRRSMFRTMVALALVSELRVGLEMVDIIIILALHASQLGVVLLEWASRWFEWTIVSRWIRALHDLQDHGDEERVPTDRLF